MSGNKIQVVSVSDFSGEKFFIPDYQRGYRWTYQQVNDLLCDINDFSKKKDINVFYCLQPLVVQKRSDGDFEVIDGQQRLTTIYLILSYLKECGIVKSVRLSEDLYEIKYYRETTDVNENSIEHHYIKNARCVIKKWFEENKVDKNSFCRTLWGKGSDVRFIWYEVEDEDPIEIFTRLNIGRIPLTDSELIKALFLNISNFEKRDETWQKIAREWDFIEKSFQDDEFYLFLSQTDCGSRTRIDMIFYVIRDLKLLGEPLCDSKNENYGTFHYFYDCFERKTTGKSLVEKSSILKNEWEKVKKVFSVFREWYSDVELYHYVGFLVDQGVSVSCLISDWGKSCDREGFLEKVKDRIKDSIKKCCDLEKVYKLSEKVKCKPLLLLHNIQTVIEQGKASSDRYGKRNISRFPFHIYKSERWDIEHIEANTSSSESTAKERKEWLFSVYDMVGDKELKKEIKDFFYAESEGSTEYKRDFESLKEEIEKKLGLSKDLLGDEEKNQIMNFVLLDSETNRSYGNSIFPFKRRVIIGKDKGERITLPEKFGEKCGNEKEKSSFIAPCTLRAFLKSYSVAESNPLCWTKSDAEAYKDDIERVLGQFLTKKRSK